MQNRSASTDTDNLSSAVSWGAILAGAAAAAALSLILLFLGSGLGLSSASPWAHEGISAKALGMSAVLWICFTQLMASGLGGYLAGRLRTRWSQVDTDEVYFRDTAHGLLTWAVATLATAALMGSVIASIASGGVHAGASLAKGVASTVQAAADDEPSAPTTGGTHQSVGYFVDSLFRRTLQGSSVPNTDETAAQPTLDSKSLDRTSLAEAMRIFLYTLPAEPLAPEDLSYLGNVVARETGLTQQAAEERVRTVYAAAQGKLEATEVAARAAADEARKASAKTALWMFISLLIGAFVASLAATFGGRQRDRD